MPQKYSQIEVFLTAHLCTLAFSDSFHGHFSCFQETSPSAVVKSISMFAPSSARMCLCIKHPFPLLRRGEDKNHFCSFTSMHPPEPAFLSTSQISRARSSLNVP